MVCSAAEVEEVKDFDTMRLPANLLRGVYSYGFDRPSPIQARAIVPVLEGGDVVMQAQSGTGKTGAFAVGLLGRLDWTRRELQVVVLAPTLELAEQNAEVVGELGAYMSDEPFCQTFVDGTEVRGDEAKLQRGVLVAAGTPGRVANLLRTGAMPSAGLTAVVLDEADMLLLEGFAEQVYGIFAYLPRDVQVVLVSTTLPPAVREEAARFMRSPTELLVAREALSLQSIHQMYVDVEEEYKLETLKDLYDVVGLVMVFCNTSRKADWVAQRMNGAQYPVSCVTAEMAPADRRRVVSAFQTRSPSMLIATDALTRGIDVRHMSSVVNFDIPTDNDTYLHRIGRSGRYGRKGTAINFVSLREVPLLKAIEADYATTLHECSADDFTPPLDCPT